MEQKNKDMFCEMCNRTTPHIKHTKKNEWVCTAVNCCRWIR